MKRIVLCLILSFSALALLAACDELDFDNIAANMDLAADPVAMAFEAYSDLLERVHFANRREGAIGLDYRFEFYGEMLAVDTPWIYYGSIETFYKDRVLDFYVTMRLYGWDLPEHYMFLHVVAQDGEIVFVDSEEIGALMIYMAVGEAMYDMLWGYSHIPLVHLPVADIDSFGNVRFDLDGDYVTIYFTLTGATAHPGMVVDADIALVLRLDGTPASISIDMIEAGGDERFWRDRFIFDYVFHFFADEVDFENN